MWLSRVRGRSCSISKLGFRRSLLQPTSIETQNRELRMMFFIAITMVLFACFLSDTRVAAYTRRSTESPLALADSTLTINGIPFLIRAHWMRQANRVLDTSCPFGAFGSVIVNHTDTTGLGELICTGVNTFGKTGNPINHGQWPRVYRSSLISIWANLY